MKKNALWCKMERLKFFGDFFGKGAARLDKEQGAAKTISLVMAVTLIGKVLGLYRDRKSTRLNSSH